MDPYLAQKSTTLGESTAMNTWIDYLLDSKPISMIFGQCVPTLKSIVVHEINLHHDGPRILLRFDLAGFPERPPKKWVESGFNRVQLRLLMLGVRELKLIGLQSTIQVDLEIFKDDCLTRVKADNGIFQLDVGAEFVTTEGISAYVEASN